MVVLGEGAKFVGEGKVKPERLTKSNAKKVSERERNRVRERSIEARESVFSRQFNQQAARAKASGTVRTTKTIHLFF